MKSKKNFIMAVVWLIITVAFTYATLKVNVRAIGPNDTKVGLAMINGPVHNLLGYNALFYKITQITGYMALLLCAFFGFVGLMQLIVRKSLLKVDKQIIVLGVLYVVTIVLYVLFDKVALNYRPMIMPGETELEASFPSSHTMLACVVYLSAPVVWKKYLCSSTKTTIVTILCSLLMAVTVIGRLLSGVHWFTDIVAAVFISMTLLSLFKGAVYAVNKEK